MQGRRATNGMRHTRQGIITVNGNLDTDFYKKRDDEANQWKQLPDTVEVVRPSNNPEDYHIHPGEILLKWRGSKPTIGDQRPTVWGSTANLCVPRAQLRGVRGATTLEKALNYLYKNVAVAGLCKNEVRIVPGETTEQPLIIPEGLHEFLNVADVDLNVGDELIMCIIPASVGYVDRPFPQGIPDGKLMPIALPMSRDIVFPRKESLQHAWQVRSPTDMLKQKMLKRFALAQDELVMESQVQQAINASAIDLPIGLEKFVKVVAMIAIDIERMCRAQHAPGLGADVAAAMRVDEIRQEPHKVALDAVRNAGAGGATDASAFDRIPSSKVVGLEGATADELRNLQLDAAHCRALNQKSWTQGAVFSKLLLSLSLGCEHHEVRSPVASIMSAEMGVLDELMNCMADHMKDVYARRVGTVVHPMRRGEHGAVHISRAG